MIPDWLAIFPNLTVWALCGSTVQLQLAWNHRLREITFADEVWHDVNFPNRFWIEQKNCVAETRFLFPKRALNIDKNFPAPDFGRVRQRRRARIRIHGRAVSDDQQRGVFSDIHPAKKRRTPNAQRPTVNSAQTFALEIEREAGSARNLIDVVVK